jgi:hypothetical protein
MLMSRFQRYHALPGISVRDPDFHDPARFTDRARFAAPVSTADEPDTVPDEPTVGTVFDRGERPTNDDFTQVPDPSPFRLGG